MSTGTRAVLDDAVIYALRHMEEARFIMVMRDGVDYLACFLDPRDAGEFRAGLGLVEYVDIVDCRVSEAPFTNLNIDGDWTTLPRQMERV